MMCHLQHFEPLFLCRSAVGAYYAQTSLHCCSRVEDRLRVSSRCKLILFAASLCKELYIDMVLCGIFAVGRTPRRIRAAGLSYKDSW